MGKPSRTAVAGQLREKRLNLKRCLDRIEETERCSVADFPSPFDRGDVLDLNLLRACETVIDMANIAVAGLALPPARSKAEAFEALRGKRVLDERQVRSMRGMARFRNVLVHQYTTVDPAIREAVLTGHLADLEAVAGAIERRFVVGDGQ